MEGVVKPWNHLTLEVIMKEKSILRGKFKRVTEKNTINPIKYSLEEAETPVLRPPDVKNRCIGKEPDAGKD